MSEMSGRKKSTPITSRPKRSSPRTRPGAQKVKLLSFDSHVVDRSTGELAAELTDPLVDAIKALKPRGGIDLIVISDGGEKYVVETKSARPKGKTRKEDPKRFYVRVTKGAGVQVSRGGGKSSIPIKRTLATNARPIVPPSTDELAERMLPEAPVPSPAQATLAQRESHARWSMLEEFGAFTSEELADHRSQAKNRHALANRWRSEGKVFSVELRGRRLYPGFQFDPETFAPNPIVAEVLAALPRDQMSDWEVALWWVAADPWLEGRRPVDVLQEDPELVAAAAAGLSEPSPL